jgi:ABC-2 type transport system permease protein
MIVTVIVPIALASFMALVFGGGGGGGGGGGTKNAIPVLVVDLDNSPLSQAVIEDMGTGGMVSVEQAPEATAAEAVRSGKRGTAVVLPAGFGRRAATGLFSGIDLPEVRLVYDPSKSMELQVVRGALMQSAIQAVGRQATSGAGGQAVVQSNVELIESAKTMDPDEKAALVDLFASLDRYYKRSAAAGGHPQTRSAATAPAAPGARARGGGGMQAPFKLVEEPLAAAGGAAAPDTRRITVVHAFVGMTVQGVLFFAIEAAMGLLRDRNRGIWRRLRAAPLSRATLLGGRMLSTVLISVGIIAAVLLFGAVVFRLRVSGNPFGFVLVCLAIAFMTATLGLLIATLGKTEAQSRGLSIFAVLVMSMLGGAWVPTFMMPHFVQPVSALLPSRWAVDGLDAMTWRGGGFSAALLPTAALVGFSLAFALVAMARFRWEAE